MLPADFSVRFLGKKEEKEEKKTKGPAAEWLLKKISGVVWPTLEIELALRHQAGGEEWMKN